ncbi:MAG TPA: tetratricopeptide repeat protein [Pseudolabrys sp.]|nr:tetratricopeptide repeat protein [Pseudolabrys sp.]
MSDKDRTRDLFLKGVAFLENRDFYNSEQLFFETLKLAPRSVPTLNNLAISQYEQGKKSDALLTAQRILEIDADNIDAYLMVSTCQKDQKRYDEALKTCHKIISIDPTIAEAHCNLGYVLSQTEKYEEAIASFDCAIKLNPYFPDAFLNLGNALKNLKRYDSAFAAYGQALTLKPGLAEAWVGRGNTYFELRRYDDAVAAYNHALSLKPDLAEAWLGRGNVAFSFKRYEDAFKAYDKALSINSELATAWLGRANVFFSLNQDAEALECFDKAIALKGDLADAHFNKALSKLSLGEYEEGWKLYEWRWKNRLFTSPVRYFTPPLWLNDSNIKDKTILIHAEQGFGDTIQFSRYLNLLKDKKCKIIFEVQKPLSTLFKSSKWQCEVIVQGEKIPSFDVHCPLVSLPLAFETRVETIPANVPYIDAPEEKKIEWAEIIGTTKEKPRIGLAWSGNPYFAGGLDISRPVPLSALGAIISNKFEWYRLQKDLRDSDKHALDNLSVIKDLSDVFNDFSDIAALIEQLDLVISIDTSIAHLAGAMGKPVWIMLAFHSDFRWLRERTDSPWYPTARLYRQTKSGDWTNVLESVSKDLDKNFTAV